MSTFDKIEKEAEEVIEEQEKKGDYTWKKEIFVVVKVGLYYAPRQGFSSVQQLETDELKQTAAQLLAWRNLSRSFWAASEAGNWRVINTEKRTSREKSPQSACMLLNPWLILELCTWEEN